MMTRQQGMTHGTCPRPVTFDHVKSRKKLLVQWTSKMRMFFVFTHVGVDTDVGIVMRSVSCPVIHGIYSLQHWHTAK